MSKRIKQYLDQSDWRIKENANMRFSYPGLLGYVSGHETAEYALENIYSKEVADAHRRGDLHVHDLSGLCNYCLGLDFEMFLMKGLDDIDGPPKHFTSALAQLHNLIFLVSQQIAGAIAFNSCDILLAPYIRKDGLSFKQIKQALQEFVYTINIPGRIGFQSPFVNFQLDITVPQRMRDKYAIIGMDCMDFKYDDLRWEIEAFNRALLEVLMESKTVKSFPVINIGITKDFNWDSKLAETIFTAIGKIGQPTINNYVNGGYDPDAVKSMCCSLRLDFSEIIKQTGGQFGAADNSGSTGVGTLNLPRYGYRANLMPNTKIKNLFDQIEHNMDLILEAQISKRTFIEDMLKKGMYPTVARFIDDFSHFFITVGAIGLNEMAMNFYGDVTKGIDSKEGYALSMEVIDFMNAKLKTFQVEHKDFYGPNKPLLVNLELVPGEGCTHRFARHDKEQFPDIITANGTGGDYYTRGCWLPADKEYSLSFATKHQEVLQDKFSGGANFNHYINEPIHNWRAVRSIVKKIVNNTSLPFISISPTISVCPICGVKQGSEDYCEHKLTQEQAEELKTKGVEFIC